MTINCSQLKDYVIKPSLNAIGLLSESAVNLLLGTCATETEMGTYLTQVGISHFSGGIGIFQMQAPTFIYIWQKKVATSVAMKSRIKLYLGYEGMPQASRMVTDLSLAAVMARLFYDNAREPLPAASDLSAMAVYYKKYWNTELGKSTPELYMKNYRKFVS